MELKELILDHAKTIAIICGAITALFIAWRNVYGFVKKTWRRMLDNLKARQEMPYHIRDMGKTIKVIDERLSKVEYEITPNHGTTMKDAMKIIKAEIEAANWLSPRPSFRTDSRGINTFANQAYCNLVGANSGELLKLGWRNFIQDPDDGDDYTRRFLESSKEFSQFSGNLKLKNTQDEYVGEWTCKIKPLGPLESDSDNYLWHGCLYPKDKVAIEHANKFNIPIR